MYRKIVKKIALILEFALLFFGVPLLIYFDKKLVHPSVIVLPILVLLFLYLRKQKDFKFKELFAWPKESRELIKAGAVILLVFAVLLAGTWWFVPEKLFNLPKGNLLVWGFLCTFYPVFSAFGQEIIYRTFLFRRYKSLFGNEKLLIAASAVAFSFVHIVYYSPISMILTLIAGIYLAITYSRTRSVLFTAVLHGIMGDIVFTIGLGEYFWLDIHKFL